MVSRKLNSRSFDRSEPLKYYTNQHKADGPSDAISNNCILSMLYMNFEDPTSIHFPHSSRHELTRNGLQSPQIVKSWLLTWRAEQVLIVTAFPWEASLFLLRAFHLSVLALCPSLVDPQLFKIHVRSIEGQRMGAVAGPFFLRKDTYRPSTLPDVSGGS